MTFLHDRKQKLGVDRPFTAARHRLAARTAARRSRLIVFAAGQARLRQGRVGPLRIVIPSKVRTLLRKAKRRGRRTISVTAVTRATIVPGVTSTRRVKIVLRLTRAAKPRR